jgi:hypothetical protein
MKNCHNCGMELADDAVFCGRCGSKQELPAEAVNAASQQSQEAPPVQPKAGPPQAPPQAAYPTYPYPPQPPRPPSELSLAARRYPGWFASGFFGTEEPMHLLFTIIVPFFVSLFASLQAARLMSWNAGGFFLIWFFTMIIMAAMPTMAWVSRRFMLKETDTLLRAFARFSSYLNMVLPISILTFILGAVLPAGTFISVLMYVVLILIFAASIMTAVGGLAREPKKIWLVILTMAGVFFVLLFLYSAISSAGAGWGAPRFGFRF